MIIGIMKSYLHEGKFRVKFSSGIIIFAKSLISKLFSASCFFDHFDPEPER